MVLCPFISVLIITLVTKCYLALRLTMNWRNNIQFSEGNVKTRLIRAMLNLHRAITFLHQSGTLRPKKVRLSH